MNVAATTKVDRIVVVDDDARIRDLLRRYLSQEGFDVLLAEDGKALSRLLARESIDLIVLDLMMPGEDGLSICRRLRATNDATPIIMLTAKVEDVDRIVGLEVGADDYLPKTFSTRELLARLRAVLRRSVATATATGAAEKPPTELVVGALRVNLDARSAVMDTAPLVLTPVEFDLLASLAKAKGRVKSREALLDECRDRNYDVFDRSIDVHISSLRKKLGDDAKEPKYIRTVRSAGYMMVGPE
ncbi:MAG: response regulator [Opitutaceae bacterium]|nr:response regulator [Opitutaceae bacterium]